MIELYERTPKTSQYPYGSRKLTLGENPFVLGPGIICIADNNKIEPNEESKVNKEIKETTDSIMNIARLRTSTDDGASISLDGFPVKFLSYKYVPKAGETKADAARDFVSKYFKPLIAYNDKRLYVTQAMKRMRNVNIATFGKGDADSYRIEKALYEELKNLGYSEQERKDILSQVFAMYIGAPKTPGVNDEFTSVSFRDVNDKNVADDIRKEYKDATKYNDLKEYFVPISANMGEFLVYGDNGEHSIKSYRNSGRTYGVIMSSILKNALSNSTKNNAITDVMIPLGMDILVDEVGSLANEARKGYSNESIQKKFDAILINSKTYPGMRVLSDGEKSLLKRIDDICYNFTNGIDRQEKEDYTL